MTVISVVIITTMNSADLIRILADNGWQLSRVKGSHHVHVHGTKGGHVVVPHPRKDLGTGLVRQILKSVGLNPGDYL